MIITFYFRFCTIIFYIFISIFINFSYCIIQSSVQEYNNIQWENASVLAISIQGRSMGKGRIRTSAKYTAETLAIGEESYTNWVKQESKKFKNKNGKSMKYDIKNNHPKCNMPEITCDKKFKYRRIDGRCNNLKNQEWGSAFQPFARHVPAEYADGFNKPRGLPPQKALPNPRFISQELGQGTPEIENHYSNFLPQIGQFFDHDITLAPQSDRRCCTTEMHGIDCWPIKIKRDDPFYSKLKDPVKCMDFTRSTAFCFPGKSALREQFNIITAFTDASNIYASDDEKGKFLRELKKGRMLEYDEIPGIVPSVQQIEKIQKRNLSMDNLGTFIAGDFRVNETPALTVLHSLWLREHNRIANIIAKLKSNWDDEKIYQETRRIVIAEWENVVFGEYLPIILGNSTIKKYKLDLGNDFTTYNPDLEPTIYTEFSTAAYRFGHSMVNGVYELYKKGKNVGQFKLRDTFFNDAHIKRNDSVDITLEGLMFQTSQKFDRHVSEDLQNHLFRLKDKSFGSDLVALTIHRGRDHGISSYSTYREMCGLSKLTSWNDKPNEIDKDLWKKLKQLYEQPTDIDLYVGGLTENKVKDAVTGPTFNTLKGMQFYAMLYGDRFFFTHKDQAGSFTKKQLEQIRPRTMGDIVCENTKIKKATKNVFKAATSSNSWIKCSDSNRAKLKLEEFLKE